MGLKPGDPGYLEESRQPMLYAVSYSMFGLATVVLALRAYCRVFLLRIIQAFDYVMLVAFIDIIVMHAMIHMQIKTGMGRHIEYSEMHPQMHEESKKVGYVQNICYQSALGFIKSSILLQYLSIASGTRIQRWVIKGLMIFVILFSLLTTISAILLCIPIRNTWDAEKFPEGCWNTATFNFITSGINTATDIVIYLLPLPVLLKLKMNKRKKYALIGIFSLAFIAVGASLGRLSSLIAWDNSGDITYDAATIPIWDAVETDVAVAAISLPLLRPLFKSDTGYGPSLSSISSRIMRNWSSPMRGSSSVFLAGHGGAFAGGSTSSTAAAARNGGGAHAAASSITNTYPSNKFPMGPRASSSDDMTGSSIEMTKSGGGGGIYDGRDWKVGRSRSKRGKDGYGVMAEEYEVQPFGEVLVTRTVMVDDGREGTEESQEKKGDEMV